MGHGKNKKKTTKKSMYIPPNWKQKCLSDYHWCAQLIDSLTEAEKIEKLNCGKPLGPVLPFTITIERSECKKEFPHDEIKQEECLKTMILKWQWIGCMKPARTTKSGKARGAKRAGNLPPDKSASGLSVFLCLGAFLSLIVVGVLLYWFLFRAQAQTSGRKAKGASKGALSKGTSKAGKSKLGKSKLGSRKSSQRTSRKASKRSKGTKSRLSAKK